MSTPCTHQANFGSSWSLRPAFARFAIAAVALSALAASFVAPDPAPETAADFDATVTLSTKVEPGDPVPLALITEKPNKELAEEGHTGQGIDVALIDSGVSRVPGLDQSDKVVYGPDLSEEGGTQDLVNVDSYGHGTHLAGIIAGDDGDQVGGIAPDSRIVSVKVAGASGDTSVAQVIAGIDWVIEHKNDNGLNIRVLNLSLGVPGVGSNLDDPLSAAVERAWDAGIVVVAAAGNRGNEVGGLDSPAVSPYVIAVGAHESYDSGGKLDWIAPWSSGGNGVRNADIVAPGRSIMSFRVPGSTLDTLHPTAVVDDRYFVGSGSSQSAAVVSGFTAAILSADPDLTPDEIKFLFMDKAKDLKDAPEHVDGRGKIRPKKVAKNLDDAEDAPVQAWPRALSGLDSQIVAPNGATWTGGTWTGATWTGGTWSGATWTGATWSGATWTGATWSGATWSGATWSGGTWSGLGWSSVDWSSQAWS